MAVRSSGPTDFAPATDKMVQLAQYFQPDAASRSYGDGNVAFARGDVGGVAGRYPHPARNLLLRHAVGADDADHHARADGPQVDFLDKALQRDNADAIEHWGRHARCAQRHRQETREQNCDGEREAESERPGAPKSEPRCSTSVL